MTLFYRLRPLGKESDIEVGSIGKAMKLSFQGIFIYSNPTQYLGLMPILLSLAG
jgi:hypothetical protein